MSCSHCGNKHETEKCPKTGYDMTCTDCGNKYFVSLNSWNNRAVARRRECPACLGKMVTNVDGCVEVAMEVDG